MKFIVTRASLWDESQPCEEAKSERYTVVDWRNFDDPSKAHFNPEVFQREWYGTGTNHRVENGCIMRDLRRDTRWVVSITSLKQLVGFQQKYGRVILTEGDGGLPRLEIYDDYIE